MSDDKCHTCGEAVELSGICACTRDPKIADLRRQLADEKERAEKAKRQASQYLNRAFQLEQQRNKAVAEILAWQQHTGEQIPYNVGMMISDLRAENERLATEWQQCHDRNAELCAEHVILKAENVRLRGELQRWPRGRSSGDS